MKIKLFSICMGDQNKALHFCTEVLGIVRKAGSTIAMLNDTCGSLIQISQLARG